jgi:NTE family protein
MINPKLGRIGLFEFHRAAEAIDAGHQVGKRMVAEIQDNLAGLL